MSNNFNIENPKLCAKNPHFGNNFAPLDEVLRVVKAGLPDDAVLNQTLVVTEEGVQLFRTSVTSIEGGVAVSSDIPFVLGKQDPQGLGSALTYHRRYGLLILFNLVGEADDDAETAQGRGSSKPAAKKKAAKPAAKPKKSAKPAAAAPVNTPTEDEGDDW